MGNKLITQIILIVTSAAIILTYIQPTFETISETQDELAKFSNTVAKAAELNAALQALVETERSISGREAEKLRTYLPNRIDNATVMRDIQNIFKLIDLPITSLNSASTDSFIAQVTPSQQGGRQQGNSDIKLVFRDFNLTFYGTYEDLKEIMENLEANAYPLEVVELDFTAPNNPENAGEDIGLPPGTTKHDITLRAFALPSS